MAWSFGQVTAGTSAVALCEVPPGACEVVITNAGAVAADVVYVGNADTVTSSDGVPVPAGQSLPLRGLPGSAGTSLWVIGAAAAIPVGVTMSTPQ